MSCIVFDGNIFWSKEMYKRPLLHSLKVHSQVKAKRITHTTFKYPKKAKQVNQKSSLRTSIGCVSANHLYLSRVLEFARERDVHRQNEGGNSVCIVAGDNIPIDVLVWQRSDIPIFSRLDKWQTVRPISYVRQTHGCTLESRRCSRQLQVALIDSKLNFLFVWTLLFISFMVKAMGTLSRTGPITTNRLPCVRLRFNTGLNSPFVRFDPIESVSTTTSEARGRFECGERVAAGQSKRNRRSLQAKNGWPGSFGINCDDRIFNE